MPVGLWRLFCGRSRLALKEPNENVIANLDIAYEPVWAIGTGHNADPSQIAEVHGAIRSHLTNSFGKASVRILYGGSVNAENAKDLGENCRSERPSRGRSKPKAGKLFSQ